MNVEATVVFINGECWVIPRYSRIAVRLQGLWRWRAGPSRGMKFVSACAKAVYDLWNVGMNLDRLVRASAEVGLLEEWHDDTDVCRERLAP